MKSIIAAVLVLAGSGALFAAELQGFQGIRFGMKVSEGKFTGPDEDGDYSFVPEGRKPDPAISYFVSVTKKTKRIYSVVISHEVPAEQAAAYLQAYVKTIGDAYGKVGRHVKPQTEEWNNFYEAASATADGVLKNSYNVWLFEDSKGAVCQVVQMFLLKGEESFTLNVSAVDQKFSNLDDTETAGGAVNVVSSEKKTENVRMMTSAAQGKAQNGSSQSAMSSDDEIATKLKTFLGYEFGKQYETLSKLAPDVTTMDFVLDKPFRYITKGSGYGDNQKRLTSLVFKGDFPDGMSLEDAKKELNAMADLLERKYGIKMGPRIGDGREYKSKSEEVEIGVCLEERTFRLYVENKRALSLGRKIDALGADAGADML